MSLDWGLPDSRPHKSLQHGGRTSTACAGRSEPPHVLDSDPTGFDSMGCNHSPHRVGSLLRKAATGEDGIPAVGDFTPAPRHGCRVGAPKAGFRKEVLNSGALEYGGSGPGRFGGKETEEMFCGGSVS